MASRSGLRMLVIDDIGLVAQCVAARLGAAAAASRLASKPVTFLRAMTISGDSSDHSARQIETSIHSDRVNYLVFDRGILDRVEAQTDPVSRSTVSYVRSRKARYTDILDIFGQVSPSARSKIKGLVMYTLDDLDVESPWFADPTEMRRKLTDLFESAELIEVIRTRTDIYQSTGQELFRTSPDDSSLSTASASDLKLYGAIVGEIAWGRIERSLSLRERGDRLRLRSWFARNFAVFVCTTLGIGIAGGATYDVMRTAFSSSWAALVVAFVFGIALPLGFISAEPRLLLPPQTDDYCATHTHSN